MEIPFTKLQGNGNDFILIDEFEKEIIPEEMKGKFALYYTDRRFGIGADGVIFLSKPKSTDMKMRLFQPDESEAEMCGNGIRCVAKYALDQGYVPKECGVETRAGIIKVQARYDENGEFWARISLGKPHLARSEIPATGEGEYKEEISDLTVYAVNTGVPHAVVFVDEIGTIDIERIGPMIRNHATFPAGANVNFVERAGEGVLTIRTFERGVEAETYSCGTGAAAAAVIAKKLGYTGDSVRVETIGGPILVYLNENVEISGPAETVYAGIIPL
ncbi:MAG: diaminopimelate epimerase [Methanomicrobiales archaeon]|nr:diaminopimelate epimerase [Methanomicrobiales archaeon]